MRETYEREHAERLQKLAPVLRRKRVETTIITNDNYLSSEQWLKKYGINASKLDFYTFLANHVFKHCNGVVDIKTEPNQEDPDFKSPAEEKSVLVNAKYCRKFVHIIWKDGEIRHVLLTGSVYRDYIDRAQILSDKIKLRMNFLKEGSRELFGTICEDSIYILIDTSSSMEAKMELVVRKLHQLMEEQIRDKRWFNIVCFNSQIVPWRSKMVEVSPSSLQSAKAWTRVISTSGSTNTLEALQFALSDKKTQGVYLLTDGRPDQPEKAILQLIHVHTAVPVHTISFNCFDKAANDFLHHLADETGGRFHLYQDVPYNAENDGPRPHVSLDLVLLQKEFEALKQVQRVIRTLRQECELMEKYKEPEVPDLPRRSSAESSDEQVISLRRKAALEKKRYKAQKSLSCLSSASSQSDVRKESLRKLVKGESDKWMLQEDRELFADEQKLTQTAKLQLLRREEIKKKLEQTSNMAQNLASGVVQGSENEPEITGKFSVEKWLKTNSLIAKKLTLIDALKPTIVRHSAKYIPVLDKHVTGKVFEEIFPDFYINSGNKDEVKFVNPTAINLESYEQKVEKQIRIYKHKLNKIVWEALSEEVKLKRFDGKGPVSFFNNKEKMMNLLEEYDWPIDDREIDLLLDEIKLGYELIQKSTDLRTVQVDSEPTEESVTVSHDDEKVQTVEKFVRSSRPKTSTAESKSRRKPANSLSAREANIIDISPVGRVGNSSVQGAAHGEKVHRPPVAAKLVTNSQKCLLQESKGLRVIARNEIDGYYYPATVLESDTSTSAIVRFANESTSNVETKHIIPRAGAISGPQLQVGDFVLAQKPKDLLRKFHPGIVLALPAKSEPQPHFYTVVLWNRKQMSSVRKLIVKVSQQRFQETAGYIHDMHNISLELQRNKSKAGIEQNMKITKYGSQKPTQILNRSKEKKVKSVASPYETSTSRHKTAKSSLKKKDVVSPESVRAEDERSVQSRSSVSSSVKTSSRSDASKNTTVSVQKSETSAKEKEKEQSSSKHGSSSKTASEKSKASSNASKKSQEVRIPSADDKQDSRRSSKSSTSRSKSTRSRSKSKSSRSQSPSSRSSSSTFKRSVQDRSPTRLEGQLRDNNEVDEGPDDTEQQVSEIQNEPREEPEDVATENYEKNNEGTILFITPLGV